MSKIVFGLDNDLATSDRRGIELNRIALGEEENIQMRAITHRELRAPSDAFASIETIDYAAVEMLEDDLVVALNMMADNYGKLFWVRSYVQNKLFRALIDNYGRGYPSKDGLTQDLLFSLYITDVLGDLE